MNIKQQQSAMLAAIFSLEENTATSTQESAGYSEGFSAGFSEGLKIYQQSLLANASQALAITFATLHSFIGDVEFTLLVKKYLQVHFKPQYDWGELGDNFATFIIKHVDENNQLLSAIAELDFACHQAERAENKTIDLTSLSYLTEHDAYDLNINFSAGFTLLVLDYPVDVIINTIKTANEENTNLTLTDIREQLSSFQPSQHYYAVWRPNFQAQYQQISQQEYQWLQLWQPQQTTNEQSLSIGTALDKIPPESFSIVDWLPKAIEQQQISSISKLPET